MGTFRIKDLKMGMILASHARDPNGRLLLPAGEEITDKNIRTLKAWGIAEVDIEGDEDEVSEGQPSNKKSEQVPTQVIEEVDELFRYTNKKHPAIKEMIELCKLRKMESQ
jgi:hypothetical protein